MKPYEMAFIFLVFFVGLNIFRLFEIWLSEYCGNGKRGGKWEK